MPQPSSVEIVDLTGHGPSNRSADNNTAAATRASFKAHLRSLSSSARLSLSKRIVAIARKGDKRIGGLLRNKEPWLMVGCKRIHAWPPEQNAAEEPQTMASDHPRYSHYLLNMSEDLLVDYLILEGTSRDARLRATVAAGSSITSTTKGQQAGFVEEKKEWTRDSLKRLCGTDPNKVLHVVRLVVPACRVSHSPSIPSSFH